MWALNLDFAVVGPAGKLRVQLRTILDRLTRGWCDNAWELQYTAIMMASDGALPYGGVVQK